MEPRCWVKFQCRGVLLVWVIVGQGPNALAVGASGGCLDSFCLIYLFSFLSPSLWEMARYRLKYCLKGPFNPKKPTNQSIDRLCVLICYTLTYAHILPVYIRPSCPFFMLEIPYKLSLNVRNKHGKILPQCIKILTKKLTVPNFEYTDGKLESESTRCEGKKKIRSRELP